MCKCRPEVKTPYCGALGCNWFVERLREMGDKRDRNNYDIGHYWNAVEEAADAIERLLTERNEAIREVERMRDTVKRLCEDQVIQIEAEKRRTAAYRERLIRMVKDTCLGVADPAEFVDAEAQKLLAPSDSGGEKEKSK